LKHAIRSKRYVLQCMLRSQPQGRNYEIAQSG
jgi:hypothetical protein